jgi:hypothetical protein
VRFANFSRKWEIAFPIEPDEHTVLCDVTMALLGVVAAGCRWI